MDDKSKRGRYVEEWSFSFENLGEKIDEFVKSVGASSAEDIKTETFTEPVGSAADAQIELDLSVGETTVKAGTPETLIDATLVHLGEVNFSVTGDAHKVVHLSQKTMSSEWM